MAKQRSVLPLSGKLDNTVYVDSKYGHFARTAPKPGQKKDEPALKKNYNRTKDLNNLAGRFKVVVLLYAEKLTPPKFYNIVNKCFRREPLDNRFVLLKGLEGMEVNKDYPLTKLSDAGVRVTSLSKKMMVEVEASHHPNASVGGHKVNCYAYEVLFLCWDKDPYMPKHSSQHSEWTFLTDDLPIFEFEFDRIPGTVEWMVCLKIEVGYNGKRIEALIGEGMKIASVGTFNKKDMALLVKRKLEKERAAAKKIEKQVTRVKAKSKKKQGSAKSRPKGQ
jgi:hypothetical protein